MVIYRKMVRTKHRYYYSISRFSPVSIRQNVAGPFTGYLPYRGRWTARRGDLVNRGKQFSRYVRKNFEENILT